MKWVRETISEKEWVSHYSKHSAYTLVDRNNNSVDICYLVNGEVPGPCIEVTDMETLRKIDLHRRSVNHSPFPLEEVSKS